MLSVADYRAFAAVARAIASEYRAEAETEQEPRKSYLLTQADQRDEHADFYESRAEIAEIIEARKARQVAA